MDNILYVIIGLGFVLAVIFAVITLVMDIRRKDARKFRRVYSVSIIAALSALLAEMIISDPASTMLLLSVFCFGAALAVLVAALVRRFAFGKKGCIKWIVPAVFLAAAIVLAGIYSSGLPVRHADPMDPIEQAKRTEEDESAHDYIKTEVDFEVRDGAEPLEVTTSRGFGYSIVSSYHLVFDKQDFSLLLDKCDVTAEDCISLINKSTGLDNQYKEMMTDFVRRFDKKYPDASLAILYHNLETLKVVVLDKYDYLQKSLSADSYGCYHKEDNAIYIPQGTEYVEGEWGFQVILHEFCHACRTSWFKMDDSSCRLQFCSGYNNTILEEAMNSVFSCSLLNYYEKDIAYQTPSNYLRIMLECMDNYGLSDYINHSEEYFLRKLDEFTGYTNYAQVIWNLITLQRSDWERDYIDIPSEKFEPIYSYIADMYYDKYLMPGMSEDEKLAVADELSEKAFFDAPDDYKIEPDFFRSYLEEYSRRTAK